MITLREAAQGVLASHGRIGSFLSIEHDYPEVAPLRHAIHVLAEAYRENAAPKSTRETLCFRLRMTIGSGGRDGRTLTITRNFESYADASNARLRSEEETRERGGAVIRANLYRVVRKGGAR